MFKDLIESSSRGGSRDKRSLFVSGAVHAILVLVLIIVPLVHYDTLPAPISYVGLPPASPPPSPPPLPAAPLPNVKVRKVAEVAVSSLMEPATIPIGIPELRDDIPDISTIATSRYGLPGGIPGGDVGAIGDYQPSAVLEYIPAVAPPPPPAAAKKPIRVASTLQTSKLIRRITPDYPPLAKQARVEGMVMLQVLVDETGNISEINIIRGHPLLVQAAVDAVKEWKYSPTLLNDEPVAVIATVTVNFVLN